MVDPPSRKSSGSVCAVISLDRGVGGERGSSRNVRRLVEK